MKVDYDIVIVGSGPAGATTARYAALGGLKVLLVDKRQELGAPIQCSGAVSARGLEYADISADPEFVSTSISGFSIFNTEGRETRIDYRSLKPDPYADTPLGYVVDRRRFDRKLMTLAERAGVEVRLKTEAMAFDPIDGGRCKVTLKEFGNAFEITASVLVGADGLQSRVGKWAGLTTHIKLKELASCLQYVVDNTETHGRLEIITGHQWAPGGYAWLFPKNDGYAEVGLGVIRTMTKKDARTHLDDFIKHSFLSERLKEARILEIQGGGVPLAAPLKRQFADNVILVGDAARHVNPITGGGIHTALRSGRTAGEFLAGLIIQRKSPTAAHLAEYQERWLQSQGKAMWELYRIKKRIFKLPIKERDELLYTTMARYFSPQSEFKKI